MKTRILLQAIIGILLSGGMVRGAAGAESASALPIVVLETDQGTVEVKLFPDVAPKACENFLTHVKEGYFNNTLFLRVVKDFVIQGGDPTNHGDGGESIWGEPFGIEVSPALLYDRPGLLGMANSGSNTNRSQFFITLAAAHHLDLQYTIFGEVISGRDVVQAINNAPVNSYERPLTEQKLLRAYVIDLSATKQRTEEVNTAFSLEEKGRYTGLHYVFGKEKASKGDAGVLPESSASAPPPPAAQSAYVPSF